jgi:hypothetical protein
VVLNREVDPTAALRQVSEWLSFSLAFCEAAWSLVHSGVFINSTSAPTAFEPSVGWTTMYGNSGGHASSWRFEQFKSSYPAHLYRSLIADEDQVLADADLYLRRVNVANFNVEVQQALTDAIRCFKTELYTPAVVMLGKASEGAWIEFGLTLTSRTVFGNNPKAKKLLQDLPGADVGFAKKLRDTVQFYVDNQGVFKTVGQQAGVTLDDVRLAHVWSDLVRETRNAVHHGVVSSSGHTYQGVSTLLLAAPIHLGAIYRIWGIARTI